MHVVCGFPIMGVNFQGSKPLPLAALLFLGQTTDEPFFSIFQIFAPSFLHSHFLIVNGCVLLPNEINFRKFSLLIPTSVDSKKVITNKPVLAYCISTLLISLALL